MCAVCTCLHDCVPCAAVIGESETVKGKSEEKMLKLKGLLKKTHNELTEAKKNESELNQTISDLQSQLQQEQLRSEEAKVSPSTQHPVGRLVWWENIVQVELYFEFQGSRQDGGVLQFPLTAPCTAEPLY